MIPSTKFGARRVFFPTTDLGLRNVAKAPRFLELKGEAVIKM